MKGLTVLGIESSCDETSASVCRNGEILSNVIASQSIHELYGGVVPELAGRAHMQQIIPVVQKSLDDAGCTIEDINGVAFTQAPGLIGALLVGASFAKSLGMALNVPITAVHHMQAHVLANLIAEPRPEFPFLCLTVSGGHTQIVQCVSPLDMKILGQTLDDAAGEAFDKSAKLLGLPYPGGPHLDKLAAQGEAKYQFAEPQIKDLDFSFSGLKTSILYFLQDAQKHDPAFVEREQTHLAASIQETIIRILLRKLKKAIKQTGIRNICLAGGVSANKGLRKAFEEMGRDLGCQTFIPAFEYCTDNAAMIAITGYYQLLNDKSSDLFTSPMARSDW